LLREILLSDAEERLRASWDPSVHLQETVRAIEELDATLNLLGERLESWSRRDVRDAGLDEVGSTATLATQLAEGRATTDPSLGPVDPAVEEARATLARLYLEVLRSRNRLESSLAEAMPRRAPNLTALLGPTLAARLIAQAGGLDRLARLPASTVQVLGAENAFFEHLRGRGPPPRHGLLFLHPDIQGRPRRDRGKLARALAGKTSIAARLDREGSPLRPELLAEFRARSEAVRQQGKRSAKRPPRR
jgi:nucleolar protein 56